MVQVDLEARHVVLSPEEDIAGRLARLRGEPQPVASSRRRQQDPDPNLFLSGGDQQKTQLGDEGVDEVRCFQCPAIITEKHFSCC